MEERKSFKVKLTGWGETMFFTIITPPEIKRDDIVFALKAHCPITDYHPKNWTPQMSYRCSLHGWEYFHGIDGLPDVRL